MFQHVEATSPARSHSKLKSNPPPRIGALETPTVRVTRVLSRIGSAQVSVSTLLTVTPTPPPSLHGAKWSRDAAVHPLLPKFTQTQPYKTGLGDIGPRKGQNLVENAPVTAERGTGP